MLDVTRNIAETCLECGICEDACAFLPAQSGNPKELAEGFLAGRYVAKTDVPYLCNICGKCATMCPEELNIGEMMLEVRQAIIDEDLPLPGMIKYVANQQKFVSGDEFFLLREAPSGTTARLFFPGCHLSGYSADLVAAAWKWLNGHDPDCGVLLTCCGAPSYDTGNTQAYERIAGQVKEAMEKTGAGELVTACSNCTAHFKDLTDIRTVSLYEVMDAAWDTPVEGAHGTWVMHDPCKSRNLPAMQDAARSLLAKAGYEVSEPVNTRGETRCCGQGGLVGYTDAKWAGELSKERADEITGDLVTFCASCRQAMRPYDTPGLHVLDLLFTSDIDTAKMAEPHGAADAKASQLRTRELLAGR